MAKNKQESLLLSSGESFKIEIGIMKRQGQTMAVSMSALNGTKNIRKIWIEFYYWTFDQENIWKASCQKPDRVNRMMVFDDAGLDRIKVKHLLKDWSLKEEDKEIFSIARVDCQCALCQKLKTANLPGAAECVTNDVLKTFYGLKPTVARTIIVEMNRVLEM